MSLSASVVRELIKAGLSGENLAAACERIEQCDYIISGNKNASYLNSERQRRFRERQKVTLCNVTNVTKEEKVSCPPSLKKEKSPYNPLKEKNIPTPNLPKEETPPATERECDIDLFESDNFGNQDQLKYQLVASKAKTKKSIQAEIYHQLENVGCDRGLILEWEAVRKSKRAAPISQTIVNSLLREASLASIPPPKAIEISIERNWQGFKADWLKNERDHHSNGKNRIARTSVSALDKYRTREAGYIEPCETYAATGIIIDL